MKTVLFYRRYRQFQGGHLKVFHYFRHLASSPHYRPLVYFDPESVWDESNPWNGWKDYCVERWEPHRADVLFLAGMDWLALPEARRGRWPKPVVNLVQHVRHADPGQPLHAFLDHRAVRICVSPEVLRAILATGRVNGPAVCIPNGIDLSELPDPWPGPQRRGRVVVCGLKKPELAARLGSALAGLGFSVEVLTERLPRPRFLRHLAQAEVAVFLPNDTEGFYLPALEAMALGAVVVCPDCVGNRSFCVDGVNCLRPVYTAESAGRCFPLRPRGVWTRGCPDPWRPPWW
jgi:hypothetical protein